MTEESGWKLCRPLRLGNHHESMATWHSDFSASRTGFSKLEGQNGYALFGATSECSRSQTQVARALSMRVHALIVCKQSYDSKVTLKSHGLGLNHLV